MKNPSGNLKKITRACVITIAALLLLEIFSILCLVYDHYSQKPDLILSRKAFLNKDYGDSMEVLHPYLGYVYNPEKNSPQLTKHHGFEISDIGFVDDKVPPSAKSDDEIIVGIFGGSFASWFSVEGIDCLLAQLRQSPAFARKKITVVRTALGGYKQPQQYFALSYLLALDKKFDIVINIDGFNEITLPSYDNVRKHVFPFYPRNWFSLSQRITDPVFSVRIGEISYLYRLKSSLNRAFNKSPLRFSFFVQAVRLKLDRILARRILLKESRLAFMPAPHHNYQTRGPSFDATSKDTLLIQEVRMWKNCSMQMSRLCRENNIRYYHILQPNQYVPNSKQFTQEELNIAISTKSPYRPYVIAGYPRLRQAGQQLQQSGVKFYDLSMSFANQPQSLYGDNCCHLNQEGYCFLGSTIGKLIADDVSHDFSSYKTE